jgi:hypothetical protein
VRGLLRGETLDLRVHGPDGSLALELEKLGELPELLFHERISLAPGEHRFELRSSGGLRGEARQLVHASDQLQIVELRLE